MKNVKLLKKFVIFVLVFAMALGHARINADAKITYRIYYKGHRYTYTGKNYKVYYNNKLVSTDKRPGLLVNGNIMIPYARCLVGQGPKIKKSYDKKRRILTLSKGDKKIVLYINHTTCYLNGVKQKVRTIPFYAKLYGTSCIMVPAKAVVMTLGYNYYYDKEKAAIYISDKNTGSPQNNTPAPESSNGTGTGNTGNSGSSSANFTAGRFKGLSTSQYISLMGPIARASYKKTGVLASVTLAQSILESGWGKSYLCQKGNNLFGMKAVISGNNWKGTTWDGKSIIRKRTGEEYGGRKVRITANFRAYRYISQSVGDHSAYLLNAMNGSKKRYAGLALTNSYERQIRIIKKGGYATSSSYVNSLIRLIRKYNLTKYDYK